VTFRLSVNIAVLLSAVVFPWVPLGCAKKPPPSDEPEVTEAAGGGEERTMFEATIAAIEIFDDRTGTAVEGRLLHMPDWTIVGQEDEFAPVLDERQREIIRDEVTRHFVPGDRTVAVDVYVLKGKQAFRVGEQKESITMTFISRVEMSNEDDVHDVRTAEGDATAAEEALDITYDQVNALYEKAIRESIRRAFERMQPNR
jgi:hypothetical protein